MKRNKQIVNNTSLIKNAMKLGQRKEAEVRTVPIPPPISTSTTVETTTIPEGVKLEQPVIEEITTLTTTETTTESNKTRLPNITNKK
jgi:hypothetical protein